MSKSWKQGVIGVIVRWNDRHDTHDTHDTLFCVFLGFAPQSHVPGKTFGAHHSLVKGVTRDVTRDVTVDVTVGVTVGVTVDVTVGVTRDVDTKSIRLECGFLAVTAADSVQFFSTSSG